MHSLLYSSGCSLGDGCDSIPFEPSGGGGASHLKLSFLELTLVKIVFHLSLFSGWI